MPANGHIPQFMDMIPGNGNTLHSSLAANFPASVPNLRPSVLGQVTPVPPPATAPAALESAPVISAARAPNQYLKAHAKRKANRTAEEKIKQTAVKSATAVKKAALKQARGEFQEAQSVAKKPRHMWSDASSLELLHLYKTIKDEHTELDNKVAGFMKFVKYFASQESEKQHFPLLASLTLDQMTSRYKAIMVIYRKVKDIIDRSGSGGLHVALESEGLAESLWDFLLEMHSGNPAADGFGQGELGDLPAEPNSETGDTDWDDGKGAPIAESEDEVDVLPPPPAPKRRKQGKKLRPSDQLTAAEQAMDSATSDDDLRDPPTATSMPRAATVVERRAPNTHQVEEIMDSISELATTVDEDGPGPNKRPHAHAAQEVPPQIPDRVWVWIELRSGVYC
ncbi:hypothetical protein PtB15_12B354 [Puccinia triticina]|nr:hypothetical protein PtB15_12B354 [Puccinia triticina]